MAAFSRRSFVKTIGAGGVGALAIPLIAARGREAAAGMLASNPALAGSEEAIPFAGDIAAASRALAPHALRLDSNENPNGPGEASLAAVRAMFVESSRYPDLPGIEIRAAIARAHGVAPENVVVGCGSGEVLRMVVHAFTAANRPLVTGAPTFEDPASHAQRVGAPVRAVPLDAALRLDLAAMAQAVAGDAGLVFLCNPNNPTGTVNPARAVQDFIARVGRSSPETTVLVDEAYFEYVEDTAYATAIPLAMENPRVIVARTFSKIYGMAGLRVGYAIGRAETIKRLTLEKLPNAVNVLGAAAAVASLGDARHLESERRLNREAKALTCRFFEEGGYRVVPSETNFIMVHVRRDSKAFQDACRARDVLVGRPFPPLTTHARISIGTLDEMRHATEVFKRVLAVV